MPFYRGLSRSNECPKVSGRNNREGKKRGNRVRKFQIVPRADCTRSGRAEADSLRYDDVSAGTSPPLYHSAVEDTSPQQVEEEHGVQGCRSLLCIAFMRKATQGAGHVRRSNGPGQAFSLKRTPL